MIVLLPLQLVPVLFYLSDAYHERNIKKGVRYIFSFILFVAIGVFMLLEFGLIFVLSTPLLLVLMLVTKPKNNTKL